MIRDIGALNQEMAAAGARFFAGGLESPSHAKSLRKQGKRFFSEGTAARAFSLTDTKALPAGIVINSYTAAGPLQKS